MGRDSNCVWNSNRVPFRCVPFRCDQMSRQSIGLASWSKRSAPKSPIEDVLTAAPGRQWRLPRDTPWATFKAATRNRRAMSVEPPLGRNLRNVTVVIPVFNQAQYLRESIDSVIGQTWRDFEIVVVDDGSTDDTPNVIATYGARIRTLRKPNGGGASAVNAGIGMARGEWVAWLSADDVWEPTKLALQMNVAARSPTIALVYSDFLYIDESGRVLRQHRSAGPRGRRRSLARLVRDNYINGSTVLVRKKVLDDVGMLDEGDLYSPDFDLWFRIATLYELAYVPVPLVRYRLHAGQSSSHTSEMQQAHDQVVARRVRQLDLVTGAFCLASYLVALVGRIPFQLKKPGRDRGASLSDIMRNNGRFFVALVRGGN